MNPENINISQPPTQTISQTVIPAPRGSSTKRALFWIVVPFVTTIIGMFLVSVNSLTDYDSLLHDVLNVVSFLLVASGAFAFLPGLIYGVVLLFKR